MTGVEELHAEVDSGSLRIRRWGTGSGTPLLFLHGGPGLSDTYLDALIDEFSATRPVATYAQRGVAPSTARGPFDLATQTEDAVAVLDALGWDRAAVIGHSWGGYLLLQLLAAHPGRLAAAIAVEPIGAVGDGGVAVFGAELAGRLPEASLTRLEDPDLGPDEYLSLIWPGYFPPGSVVPSTIAGMRLDDEAMEAGQSAMLEERGLADRLQDGRVPVLFITGDGSPVPATASTDTAAVIGRVASVRSLPGGHFPWLVAPGAVASVAEPFLGEALSRAGGASS